MKNNRKCILCSTLVVLCFCTLVQASDSNLTPLPGDPLRTAVLDALRQEVKGIAGEDVVFVVDHLKVKDGWAWVHTRPQSPDGSNRYEDLSALMRLQNGAWSAAEIPCGEAEDPSCIGGSIYFSGLQRRFPSVPTEIVPSWARGVKD